MENARYKAKLENAMEEKNMLQDVFRRKEERISELTTPCRPWFIHYVTKSSGDLVKSSQKSARVARIRSQVLRLRKSGFGAIPLFSKINFVFFKKKCEIPEWLDHGEPKASGHERSRARLNSAFQKYCPTLF